MKGYFSTRNSYLPICDPDLTTRNSYPATYGPPTAPHTRQHMLIMIIVITAVFFAALFCPLISRSQAQEALSFEEKSCLVCHEKIFDTLPPYVHNPFLEKKCCSCHKFQFENINHQISFASLAPENTYYFRLKGYVSEDRSIHVSQKYSFTPPLQGGALIEFSDSEGFSQLELMTDRWDSSSATLSWQTESMEYCLVEWDIHDSFTHITHVHSENFDYLKERGITACYQADCHPQNSLGVSHPVNIFPSENIKKKMTKAHLPTGKNGLLLCLTCHAPHAGQEKPRGRKAVSEELCIACHPKEIYNPE